MGFFSPEQVAALSARVVRCDFLVEMRFKSETVRVHNGHRPFTSGGHEWKPLHGAGRMDGISVAGSSVSSQVTLSMPGIPDQDPDILALALSETDEAFQRLALIAIQFFDENWTPIGAPLPLYWGFMQPPEISRSAASATEGAVGTVSVTIENAFFNRSLPPCGRYTPADQNYLHPGDKFFDFTSELLFKTFIYPDY